MPQRPTVCIAGMHRSGTSLTASWLARCGLPISLGRLSGAQVGNRPGEFEDVDFRQLHARAITRHVPGSAGWRVEEPRPLRLDGRERLRMAQHLRRRDRRFDLWGFKDPRSAFFLDEWARRRRRMVTLVVWRSRAAVVDSLLRRSAAADDAVLHIEPEAAGRLWDATSMLLVEFAEANAEQCLVVRLETLFEVDDVVFDRLGRMTEWDLAYAPLDRVARPGELDTTASDAAVTDLEHRLASLSLSGPGATT
ncbi:MAG: hypothetical protein JJU45_07885 [Acidimicrobiia bacterium]|nr:hypothetical protein [Acidimicrobiia bacterium]